MTGERAWFITGASSGLGRVLAEAALERGDPVAGTARDPKRLADLVAAGSGRFLPVTLEVTDPVSCRLAVETVFTMLGRVDILINNAGITQVGCVEEVSDEVISKVFATNFFGPLEVLRAALPHLRRQGGGHVINVSSTSGIIGLQGNGIYSASKFALEGVSEALRDELRPLGVRVTILEPGKFSTGLTQAMERAAPIGDYEPVWEYLRRRGQEGAEKPPNDLSKVASAVLRMLDADDPPERLILGSDGVDLTTEKLKRVLAEAEAWESVSRSVDS